ncbi:hypothetical protein RI367_001033 [Sorochytrium milnesiophthora]
MLATTSNASRYALSPPPQDEREQQLLLQMQHVQDLKKNVPLGAIVEEGGNGDNKDGDGDDDDDSGSPSSPPQRQQQQQQQQHSTLKLPPSTPSPPSSRQQQQRKISVDIAAIPIDPTTILVALPDPREEHIEPLLNSPVLDSIAACLDAAQLAEFTTTLLASRDVLPDAAWVGALSRFLVHTPALLDALLQLLGWFGDELFDALDAYESARTPSPAVVNGSPVQQHSAPLSPPMLQSPRLASPDMSSGHERASSSSQQQQFNGDYLDHPSYHIYQSVDTAAIRSHVSIMSDLEDRYPQFFEAVKQYLIGHRCGIDDYHRFIELFFKPREELSDDAWKSKCIEGYIGAVPRLMCDLREIVALELGCIQNDDDDDDDEAQEEGDGAQAASTTTISSPTTASVPSISVQDTSNNDDDNVHLDVHKLSLSAAPLEQQHTDKPYRVNAAKLIEAYQRAYATSPHHKDSDLAPAK